MRKSATLAGALAIWCCAATQAVAAEFKFEGEAMTPSSPHVVAVDDMRASNDRALKFLNNDRASYTFTTDTAYARILFTLLGDQCGNPPQPNVEVELDGTDPEHKVWSSDISATDSYKEYEAFVDVPPGTHTLYIHMTNDFNRAPFLTIPGCSRNIWLDTVTLKDMPSMFAPDSYRNAPLPDNAPIDEDTEFYEYALERYLDGNIDDSQELERGVNVHDWSTSVYTVPVQQATVPVVVHRGTTHSPKTEQAIDDLEAQWTEVPLPPGARAADWNEQGRDKHLVVYQPETDKMWEFFGFSYNPVTQQPRAVYGGLMEEVSRNPGHFTDPTDDPQGPGRDYGASATSIPLLVGLQTVDELLSGSIDHAVAFNVPNVKEDFCRWPAMRTDGLSPEEAAAMPPEVLPEGIRFRLPADLDIDAIEGMTDYGRMVARAVQRYGMVLTDSGGNFTFEAEDWSVTTTEAEANDPLLELLGPWSQRWGPNGILRNFPWGDLQALAETGFRNGDRCDVDPEDVIPEGWTRPDWP